MEKILKGIACTGWVLLGLFSILIFSIRIINGIGNKFVDIFLTSLWIIAFAVKIRNIISDKCQKYNSYIEEYIAGRKR